MLVFSVGVYIKYQFQPKVLWKTPLGQARTHCSPKPPFCIQKVGRFYVEAMKKQQVWFLRISKTLILLYNLSRSKQACFSRSQLGIPSVRKLLRRYEIGLVFRLRIIFMTV
ncbi:uncharacterized protein RAG0_16646 [Rhynchosporium agropyri]|uniref:Uncharacterized protein n=1 Tax=Rhynchosporium agropyri TaxID=914238 RepID=A0A1E1LRF3_9HELO|nr:uncharacterized protein RAG0_16646 [Rhynchosporium agropyri]